MAQDTIEVMTNELKLGMYVSRLDRPWLETPFLFQGFYITSSEDIDELRRHCEYVYVDITKRELYDRPMRRSGGGRRSHFAHWKNRLMSLVRPGTFKGNVDLPASRYENTATVKEEAGEARATHKRAYDIISQVTSGLRTGGKLNLEVVQTVVTPMVDSVLRNNDALAWLTRLKDKDDYAYNHSIATSVYCIVLGRHLGLGRKELELVGLGGLLLDIGKTRLPVTLLCSTQPLSPAQREHVQEHVRHGIEILHETGGMDPRVIEMVRTHHERHNGTGYPGGLKGSDIPLFGRIAGICDTFDAMTTERPYAKAKSCYDAMRELNSLADVDFKAELVEQFIQAVGMFPTGTLVEISTGEVGVVVAQNRVRRLRPTVMLVLGADKQPLKEFKTVDLREQITDEDGKNSLWITRGLEPGAFGIDPAEYYL